MRSAISTVFSLWATTRTVCPWDRTSCSTWDTGQNSLAHKKIHNPGKLKGDKTRYGHALWDCFLYLSSCQTNLIIWFWRQNVSHAHGNVWKMEKSAMWADNLPSVTFKVRQSVFFTTSESSLIVLLIFQPAENDSDNFFLRMDLQEFRLEISAIHLPREVRNVWAMHLISLLPDNCCVDSGFKCSKAQKLTFCGSSHIYQTKLRNDHRYQLKSTQVCSI